MTPFDQFCAAYGEAQAFFDSGPDDETHEQPLSPELEARNAADCLLFWAICDWLRIDWNTIEFVDWRDLRLSDPVTMAAHDFWLTRQGHGTGFWDRDWPEPAKTRLDELSKWFGVLDLYSGDDGLVYPFPI